MKRTAGRKVSWGRAALALLGVALAGTAGIAGWALAELASGADRLELGTRIPMPEPEPRIRLLPASFTDLPGWARDDLREAVPALLASCGRWRGQPPDRPVGEAALGGTVADWQPFCAGVSRTKGDPAALRGLLERELRPVAVTNLGNPRGLFTGYYEPTLHGSRRRHGRYRIPLHAKPAELVAVDLGRFRESLKGQRIAGRVADGQLVPFPDRSEIVGGALSGRRLELFWVDDAVDAFFLQIQGSGRLELDDGRTVRVGYAGQNGHPYTAIGRELIDRGELTREEVSMQTIRAWLEAHPDEAEALMATNASYVFFRELGDEGPYGAFGVPLTPGRSLAIDPVHLPMGVPVWLDARAPDPDPSRPDRPLERLLVAQDTGGAIRGVVRGDVFWGPGDEAAEIAGRMKHPGRLWLLLPRSVELPAEGGAGGGTPP